jgi:hypothetical protein
MPWRSQWCYCTSLAKDLMYIR